MSITAMKLALDALEYEARCGNDGAYLLEREALRQAIEQAPYNAQPLRGAMPWEQLYPQFEHGTPQPQQEFGDTSAAYMVGVQDGKKQREWVLPEIHPVMELRMQRGFMFPLKFSARPQREWVGLTDEERNHIWDVIGNSDAHGDVDGWSGRDVMAAIEAKLKEKNT